MQLSCGRTVHGADASRRTAKGSNPAQPGPWGELSAMALGMIDWTEFDRASVNSRARVYPVASSAQEQEGTPPWQEIAARTYKDLRNRLVRFLWNQGLSTDAAEDVIQEAFFRLAGQLHGGEQIDNPSAWIFQVAHHLCMDYHRAISQSRSRMTSEFGAIAEPLEFRTNPEWVFLQKEKQGLVRTAMVRLTPQQCRGFQLRASGLRYREIAADLGVSEQRAIHLVKRALERLGRIQR